MRLPHRFPLELVDRVDGETALVRWTVGAWWLRHGAAAPISLIVEAAAQAAALLLGSRGPQSSERELFLAGLEGVRLERPLAAGSTLEIRATRTGRYGASHRIAVEFLSERGLRGSATLLVAEL